MEHDKDKKKVEDFFPEDKEDVEVEVSPNFFFVSPSHSKLFTALAKAQGEIEAAEKKKTNPFYDSKYADIHDIGQAVKKPLADNDLFYMQMWEKGKDANELLLRTMIGHASGEEIWFVSSIFCPDPTSSQKVGASLTYSKRYALAGALGVTSTERNLDDDANILTFSDKAVYKELETAAKDGVEPFRTAWRAMSKLNRNKVTQKDKDALRIIAETADKKNGTKTAKPRVVQRAEQEAHSV